MATQWVINFIRKTYTSLGANVKPRHVFKALDELYQKTFDENYDKAKRIAFDLNKDKFVLLSDQHRGNGDNADDFRSSTGNFDAALKYYYDNDFTYINMGDSEECWKNPVQTVIDTYYGQLQKEAAFLAKNKLFRLWGNHDNNWSKDELVKDYLKPIYGAGLLVLDSLMLCTTINDKPIQIFLAHGHQGDDVNDKYYKWTKWKVRFIWAPIERWIRFNPNKPSNNYSLKNRHNHIMYEWSKTKENTIFISGHTHVAVFQSLNLLERLNKQLKKATDNNNNTQVGSIKDAIIKEEIKVKATSQKTLPNYRKPSYYNTGCCCYSDGDITGIEIENGYIRLIKWEFKSGIHNRKVQEEATLEKIASQL